MGIPVLCLGQSGSGKSTSMRNFAEDEIGIFNVAGKPLPFRKKLPVVNNARYDIIRKVLTNPKLKTYVIDDSQYLLAFALFDKAKEQGYTKFTNIAVDFRNLIQHIIVNTPDDCIVYFMHHTEKDETGMIKAKTVGKMLDNALTVEGLFSVVLMAEAEGRDHYFITQSDGTNTCKSPMDMFADYKIDNDLKMVDETIREYWGLK